MVHQIGGPTPPTLVPMAVSPFFVIGYPRSGTTLLRLALTANNALVVPPECSFITWLHGRFGDSRFRTSSSVRRGFARAVTSSRKFETWGIPSDHVHLCLEHDPPCDYAEACARIYALFAERAGRPNARWGDKNNIHLEHTGLLLRLFPSAHFIVISRDPRDVLASNREVDALDQALPHRPQLLQDPDVLAEDWATKVGTALDTLRRGAEERLLVIRYEDLVAAPRETLASTCQHLGVAFADEMVGGQKASASIMDEPAEMMPWKRRVLEPITRRQVGRYAADLTRPEVAVVERRAGVLMRELGYL